MMPGAGVPRDPRDEDRQAEIARLAKERDALRAARQAAETERAALAELAEQLRRENREMSRTVAVIQAGRAWRLLQRYRRLRAVINDSAAAALVHLGPLAHLCARLREFGLGSGRRIELGTAGSATEPSPVEARGLRRWLGCVRIGGESKPALLVDQDSAVTYRVRLPTRPRFLAHVAILPSAWATVTGGVEFSVTATSADGRRRVSKTQHVDPWRSRLRHRRWISFSLALPGLADRDAEITLVTRTRETAVVDACALWGRPVLISAGSARLLPRAVVATRRDGFRKTLGRAVERWRATKPAPPVAPTEAYRVWIEENEPDELALAAQREAAKSLGYRPLISVITPVYDIPPEILRSTLESVIRQTYDHWELCIVDGNPGRSEIGEILTQLEQRDARIRVKILDGNLGISGNSNVALAMGRGEFVALLDHDDLLAPFALYEVVRALNDDPELDIVYSDRDLVDVTGRRRFGPLFKPEWSPSMLFSASYLTHLSVIRRELVKRVGGFRPETDGAQDWDLFLRVTRHTDRVAHVPKVLYHWRTAPASVTRGIAAKPYALNAQLRAMADALVARGIPADVTRSSSGRIRFRWRLTEPPRVSVIIRTGDGAPPGRAPVESVLADTAYPDFEVVWPRPVPSPPEVGGELEEVGPDPRVRAVRYPGSGNPSAVWNWAATKAGGEVLVFLNAELGVLEPDWLQEMVGILRGNVGLVGVKVLGAGGTIHQAGVVIPRLDRALHLFCGAEETYSGLFGPSDWYRDLLSVCECLMIRRPLFEALGGYDERWRSCAADAELCLRARRGGWRVVYTPFARLVQRLAGPPGPPTAPSFEIPFRHHDDILGKGDPFFGPHLSPVEPIPTLDLHHRRRTV